MRNLQKGFITLIAILLIGGGTYVYTHNKQASQSAIVNPTTQTTQSTWIGTSYCSNAQPTGTKDVGNYNNLHLVLTTDGEELWAISALDQSKEFLNHTKDCPQIFTVRATLKFPPIESGLTLAIGNCKAATPLLNAQIVDLVDKKAYMTQKNPLTVLQPTQAWKVGLDNPAFEPIPVSEITCYSNEPDPS